MKVLIVTGDRAFKAGHPRYALMAGVADIEVVYVGRGSLRPRPHTSAFDVVTSQDPFWRGIVAIKLARRYRARLNVQVHADLDAQPIVKRVLAQYVLNKADSVRVVSEKLKTQVLARAPKARVTILPVYIDLARFRKVAHEPSGAQKTVLWIGRFEREKDPFAAIRVFKEVLGTGVDARLIMLGTGTLEPFLKGNVEGLPIEFPGWQDPVPYLARADAILVTSPAESFGVSIIEALAAGVPVVSTDVGIAREAGATVVPRDQLADTLAKTLQKGERGILSMNLPDEGQWTAAWLKTFA